MKVFDLHADLGWHILHKTKENEKDILKRYHIDKLKQGEIVTSAAACFFEGYETWEDMKEMIQLTHDELLNCGAKWIVSKEDLDESNEETSFILTVEGMCGIKENPLEKIQWMYDQGVRIASLCWNDDNNLATGVHNDPLHGLKPMGMEVVKKMNELGMIIDVSHANEHTFWDLIECSTSPIIATHSNARYYSSHVRNLTDEQIIAIANKGGLIGLNSCSKFISLDESKQDAYHLALHAKYMKDLVGVEYIACGFDYMDFFPADMRQIRNDLFSADQTQNFIKALYEVGFTKEEVEMIAYKNVINFLKKNMK